MKEEIEGERSGTRALSVCVWNVSIHYVHRHSFGLVSELHNLFIFDCATSFAMRTVFSTNCAIASRTGLSSMSRESLTPQVFAVAIISSLHHLAWVLNHNSEGCEDRFHYYYPKEKKSRLAMQIPAFFPASDGLMTTLSLDITGREHSGSDLSDLVKRRQRSCCRLLLWPVGIGSSELLHERRRL